MAATQNQRTSIEQSRIGIVAKIKRYGVVTTCIVNLLQSFIADRDELRLIIGSTTRLGIPLYTTRPKDIALTMTHTVYLTLQLLIGIDRIVFHEILITLSGGKTVFSPIFGILCSMDQMFQHCALQCLSPTLMLLQSLLTGLKNLSYNLSKTHVVAKFCLQNYTKPS